MFFCISVFGQEKPKKFIFDHYYLSQGFSSAQALCIIKASNDYLWIGTEHGLVRFNGHNFKNYVADPFDKNALSHNYIKHLKEDKHGRIWIIANETLHIYDPKTDLFQRIEIIKNKQTSNTIPGMGIYYNAVDDVMWISSSKGLFFSQGKTIQFQEFFIEGLQGYRNLTHGSIEMLDDCLYLSNTFGIHRFNFTTCALDVFHRSGDDPTKIDDDGILSTYMDGDSILWLGLWVNGLVEFNVKTLTSKRYEYQDSKVLQNGVLCISRSLDNGLRNKLWLGTTDGVQIFDTKTKKFTSLRSENVNDPNGVPGAGFAFFPTKEEGIWIGTAKGLHRYDHNKQYVQNIGLSLGNRFEKSPIQSINFEHTSKRDSAIWFMIAYNKFFRHDLVNDKPLPIPQAFQKYCALDVGPHDIYIDSRNIVWTSSIKYGLNGYDFGNGKVVSPSYEQKGEKPQIISIKEDRNGKLWFGSITGIYTLDLRNAVIHEERTIRDYLAENKQSSFISELSFDEANNVWLLSTSSDHANFIILKYNPSNGQITRFDKEKYRELSYLNTIESVYALSDTLVLLSSLNGFCTITYKNEKPLITRYTSQRDNKINSCSQIITDNDNNFWMNTDFGIMRFDPVRKSIENYTIFNSNIGSLPRPFLRFSAVSNKIYMGQISGIDYVDTRLLQKSHSKSPLITNISISKYGNVHLPQSGDKLALSYKQNSIVLELSNFNYTNSADNSYSYQLLGSSNDWQPLKQNTLSLNNIGAGNYTLHVKSKDGQGLECEKPFTLYLTISPPFWKTLWFNGISIFLAYVLLYSMFKYREMQRVKLEHLRLRVARDLHDDIGSNLSLINMLSEMESLKSKEQTSYSKISAKTKEVMNSMSEIVWSINPKHDNIQDVLYKIQEYAIEAFEAKNTQLNVYFPDDLKPFKMSIEARRNIYLIFKEAINNAAKYSKAQNVTLSCKLNKNVLELFIEDNGKGFDPWILNKGNGMKNMRERTALIGGEIRISTSETGTSIVLHISTSKLFQ